MSIDIRKANEALKDFYMAQPIPHITRHADGCITFRCDGGCHTGVIFDPKDGPPDGWHTIKWREKDSGKEGFFVFCDLCYPIAKNLYDSLFGDGEQ